MAIAANAGVILEWCLVGISTIFVLVRLYVRLWLQARVSLSDAFMVTSFGFYVTTCILDTIIGRWSSASEPYILRLLYDSTPISYSSLWCVKAALVLMFYQLIPAELVRLRRWLNILAVFVGGSWAVVLGMNAFWCGVPLSRNWEEGRRCRSYEQPRVYYTTLALHMASDVGLYLLPLFLLQALQLSRRKQLGVAGMVVLGTICIACAIGRAVSVGTNATIPSINIWRAAETATAISVACCPSLKWLFKSFRGYYKAKREAEGEREEWATFSWSKKTGIGSGNWIHELDDSDKDDEEGDGDGVRMTAFFVGRSDEENFAGEGPSGMAGIRMSREIEQKSEHEFAIQDEDERKEV